ncbi:ABC transporter substrate-binding protein [Olsenella uli]|uniref:ABC transporter substrate-binding protein n=1 Tax=Olsenella uli TaxID=133926 RepID=UPI00241CB8C5|nr:ABC transporter substrate-binding protein [Olsenella uli]
MDTNGSSITRRTFIRGGLGAALAAAGVGLMACGGPSDAGGTDVPSDTGEPKVLRFGVSNPKVTFDTQKTSNDVGVSEAVAEALVNMDPDTKEIYPVLLTTLPSVSSDGLTYSFTLKDDVKFHNGETLKSSDVKYTLTRMFLPETKATSIDSFVYIKGSQDIIDGVATELSGVQVQDDTHFTIELTQPYSTFLAMMSEFYAIIYPEKACTEAGEAWGSGTTFIGTGPFRLESNDDSTEVVLKAFEDYHEGKVDLDEVDFVYIDDANTRMLSYKNADIDLAFIDRSLIKTYAADDDVKDDIVYYAPASTQFVNLNLKDEKLADVRVRQALSLAINRREICDTVLSGAAEPASCFCPSSESGHDGSYDVLDYDVEKAKSLLAEAGADGLALSAQVRSQDQDLMVALQDAWSKIGVSCDVQVIDNGVWSESRKNGTLQVTLVTWSTLCFQGIEHMGSYFRSDRAAAKSSFYESTVFDALVDEARQTTDGDSAIANLAKQADKQLVRIDYACLPVCWPQMPYALKSDFKGLQVLVNPLFRKVTKG